MSRKFLAFWSYDGNSPAGKDHARKGPLSAATLAAEYAQHVGSAAEFVAPSRAGVKAENSSFGHVVAVRVNDPQAIAAWARKHIEGGEMAADELLAWAAGK